MPRKIHNQAKIEPIRFVLDEEFFRKEFSFSAKLHENAKARVEIIKKRSRKIKSEIHFSEKYGLVPASEENPEPTPGLWETIDLAMELQQNLFEISSNIIATFQFQLLLIVLEAFVAIVFNCYYILSIFYNPSHFRLPPKEAGLFLAYQLMQPIMNLLAITITCMMTIRATETTQQIVNKLIISTSDANLRQRLSQFSMQIKSSTPVFNVLGLFKIDGSLLFSIAASTTTYLVILVQYSE